MLGYEVLRTAFVSAKVKFSLICRARLNAWLKLPRAGQELFFFGISIQAY